MWKISFILFFLFCFCSLYSQGVYQHTAEELPDDNGVEIKNSMLADLEKEPSSIVNHSVNVITGNFVDYQIDLIIPGAQALIISRSYCSSDHLFDDYLNLGWHLNHYGKIELLPGIVSFGTYVEGISRLQEGNGAVLDYYANIFYEGKKDLHYFLQSDCYSTGVTNCSLGAISGKTNILNKKLTGLAHSNTYQVNNGDGSIQTYARLSKKDRDHRYLSRDDKPNGNSIHYAYDENMKFQSIHTANKDHKIFGQVTFNYPGKHLLEICSSQDQRKVLYHFVKEKVGHHKYYLLTSVERPNNPKQDFIYHRKKQKIFRMEFPDNRFIENYYYSKGINDLEGISVKIKKHDPCKGFIKLQKAPVGTDATPITTHRYLYQYKMKKNKLKHGATTVLDAHFHKTIYEFSRYRRLTSIKKFKGTDEPYTLYSTEKLFWGEDNAKKRTLLKSRSFEDMSGNVQFCRTFQYDAYGNVIEDRLYGNLSGSNAELLIVDEHGEPISSECEYTQKKYTYSNDGMNLTLSEIDNRKTITYSYKPGTNLLTRKLTWDDDSIRIREFFEYDDNGVVIKKTIDDGKGSDFLDPVGVSERRIEMIVPTDTYPIGLPEIVINMYLDPDTGAEHQLSKVVNHYSHEGHLNQQDHYDAEDTIAFSLYWKYDSLGNVIEQIDALGHKISRVFDANGNLLEEDGPGNRKNRYTYDYSNRLIRKEQLLENGDSIVVTYTYDYLGNKIAETDMYGNETRLEYDEFGRLVKTIRPSIFDEKGNEIHPVSCVEYDVMSNPVIKTYASGYQTRFTFNIRGQSVEVCYPDGSKQKKEYNLDGTLKRSISKNGLVTAYTYDFLSRPVKKEKITATGELLEAITYAYNAFHVLSETDASGVSISYRYNGAGRLVAVHKGDHCTRYEYDAFGRRVKTYRYVSQDSYITTIQEYDLLNRCVEQRVEDSSGTIQKKTTFAYDEKSNRTHVNKFLSAGISTHTTLYNSRDLPIEEIDPEDNSKQIHYKHDYLNEHHQVVGCKEIIDHKGRVTMIISDALGNESSIIRKNAFGQTIQKQKRFYDANGNQTFVVETVFHSTDEKQQLVTCWEYDSCNRIVKTIESYGTLLQRTTSQNYNLYGQKEATIKPDGTVITYQYNAQCLLKNYQSTDGSFHYEYHYDSNLNPIRIDDHVHHTSTTKNYDANDRLLEETLANGLSVRYDYDGLDRLTKVIFPDGSKTEYLFQGIFLSKINRLDEEGKLKYSHRNCKYDLSGKLLEAQLVNGSNIVYEYDILGRNIEILSEHWSQSITSYDKSGNLKQRVIEDNLETTTLDHEYDDLDQLTSETGSIMHQYAFDSVYNPIEIDGISYHVNTLNQVTFDGRYHYRYDVNGNLIEKSDETSLISFQYDGLDRLETVTLPDKKICYMYDESSRCLSRELLCLDGDQNKWIVAERKRFLYQGQNEIGAVDEQGNSIELRILGAGCGAEIGATVALELNKQLFTPIHDHNGNLVTLVDVDRKVHEFYRYSPFGEEEIYNDAGKKCYSSMNPWRFSSKRKDQETGLIHFGRRVYDPALGRWMTKDPIGYEGGPNLYAYVQNNPLTHVDLYGLMKFPTNNANNHSLLCRFSTVTGRFIKMIGDHFIPVPIVRDVISLTGHLIAGGKLNHYQNGYYSEHSNNYHLHDGNIDDKRSIIYVNGILNRLCEAFSTAFWISQSHAGTDVHFSHNASHGLVYDIAECIALFLGFRTRSVDQLITLIRDRIHVVGGVDGCGQVDVYAHSKGGLILSNALKYLSPEEKRTLNIRTFGTAKLISDRYLNKRENFVSRRDGTSCLINSFHIFRSFFSKSSDITLVPSNGAYFLDHSILGNTYGNIIQEDGQQRILEALNP